VVRNRHPKFRQCWIARTSSDGFRSMAATLQKFPFITPKAANICSSASPRDGIMSTATSAVLGSALGSCVGQRLPQVAAFLYSVEIAMRSCQANRSNHALERTAPRFAFTFCLTKTFLLRATRVPDGRRSAYSR